MENYANPNFVNLRCLGPKLSKNVTKHDQTAIAIRMNRLGLLLKQIVLWLGLCDTEIFYS